MAIRIPRGYARNRPYFREVCEGQRPNIQAARTLPYTGLPHVRVDEVHHDPIVLDPGTIVGLATGGATVGEGTMFPAVIGTGLIIAGSPEASTWSMPITTSGDILCGTVKPLGVVFAPAYSSRLEAAFTNYKRQHSVAFLTDYVIQVPATNVDEVAIEPGDVVMLGDGRHYGIGWTSPYLNHKQAGRYAKYNSGATSANERVVGRCLKKVLLGTGTAAAGTLLADDLTAFVPSAELNLEFAELGKVETVPGLSLSGAETKGVPAFLLGARADANGKYWALTMLIRL